jgi:hypothetical protein
MVLLWGWRVGDVFRSVPAYGDVLEVLWGIEWYRDSLFVNHRSPLFTPLVFHPGGWHTATLAHTPLLFVLGVPLYTLGGVAFAYNALCIVSFFVAFAGCQRFARLYASGFAATLAALVFTFLGFRWLRVGGHLHTAWTSSLLPWLLWGLDRLRRVDTAGLGKRWLLFCGLCWGMMICFSLYGLFLGVICFAIWGGELLRFRRLRQAAGILTVALLVAAPVVLLYWIGVQADGTTSFGIESVWSWGASLNSLFVPSLFQPLAPIRRFARWVYEGRINESAAANLGLVTLCLAVSGLITSRVWRGRQGLLGVTAIGLTLALGLTLRWNGESVPCRLFQPVTVLIWRLGYLIKPALFGGPIPSAPFEGSVPLPGLFLTAVVPFWESARTMSRYALVGGLGLIVLAAMGLQRLPRWLRYFVALVWLVEVLPAPTGSVPVPTAPHPAYAWVAQQPTGGQGILDLEDPGMVWGGEILYATHFHGVPTAAGMGSFLPEPARPLWEFFLLDKQGMTTPKIAHILSRYEIRYVLVHIRGDEERALWRTLSANPALDAVGCFEPLPTPSPWDYPICIARVRAPSVPTINVYLEGGWSAPEDWGVWAEGESSQAEWVATAIDEYRLSVEAFPHCVPNEQQGIRIEVNGVLVGMHTWQDCETWVETLQIPRSAVQIDWNELSLKYAYSARPVDVTNSVSGDRRDLSVGFTRINVERQSSE